MKVSRLFSFSKYNITRTVFARKVEGQFPRYLEKSPTVQSNFRSVVGQQCTRVPSFFHAPMDWTSPNLQKRVCLWFMHMQT